MARPRITPEIERLVVATIRNGGYPHIAAAAAGIPRPVFERWLERGQASAAPPYRQFWERVQQARAHARLSAEMEVRKKDVKFWLRYGPGKDRADAPGWTSKPTSRRRRAKGGEVQEFLGLLMLGLERFPDARQAVADLVESLGNKPVHFRRAGH
jgi:hypothetical protein